MKAGRIFLHEHPKGASSWKDEEMQKLMAEDGVHWVSGPMCNWGMKLTDREGERGFVRKETTAPDWQNFWAVCVPTRVEAPGTGMCT